MKSFSIDRENHTSAVVGGKQTENAFRSEAELYKLTAEWPVSRLVEIWNSILGFRVVKKFTDRKTAVARIWKAIQNLESGSGAQAPNVPADETTAVPLPTPAKVIGRASVRNLFAEPNKNHFGLPSTSG